jgi:Raf kinase inhibitor-like YbhB/YbcL family protein
LSISSPAFVEGQNIPVKYTCASQNVSPPLRWKDVPAETASFALIMDDPDTAVGTFTHWVMFNVPADVGDLPEGVPADTEAYGGATQGKNGGGRLGYFGPCPPPGAPHHYRFFLYALDIRLNLAAGASKEQVLKAMEGHILGQGQLVGLYQR